MPLTDTKVKNAEPRDKKYRISDGEGLFMQIEPNGGKYWRLRYFWEGKEQTLSLGVYPTVCLSEARDRRYIARKDLANGLNPGTKKKEQKQLARFKAANTFQAIAKEWFDLNQEKWVERHAKAVWRRLEMHIFPHIGRMPIAEIQHHSLLDAIRRIEANGTTEASKRAAQTCGIIFRYANRTGRCPTDPSVKIHEVLKPHTAKHFPTISRKELPEFFQRLQKANISRQSHLAIRLLMLTFLRTGEMRKTKWADIDFEAKEWRVPAEHMKKRTLHIVPLAYQTIELLKELKTLTGTSEYILPAQNRRKSKIISDNTINQALKRMGYKGKLVGHGFRSLASTTLNELEFSSDVIERQLAHQEQNKIRAAYNHAEYLPQRRIMMQKWADYLANIEAGGKVIMADFSTKEVRNA